MCLFLFQGDHDSKLNINDGELVSDANLSHVEKN